MGQEATSKNIVSRIRDRIPVGTKISYGLGTALDMWGFWLYPGVAFAVFNIYLGVDPWLVGLALTLIRIYDAISDPITGWISDNFRSKFGRRRPFILVAGVLAGPWAPCSFPCFSFMGSPFVSWFVCSFLVYDGVINDIYPYYGYVYGTI